MLGGVFKNDKTLLLYRLKVKIKTLYLWQDLLWYVLQADVGAYFLQLIYVIGLPGVAMNSEGLLRCLISSCQISFPILSED